MQNYLTYFNSPHWNFGENNYDFHKAIRDKLSEIALKYNIEPLFVGLFGSHVKGYHGPDSDYDFYVPYVGELADYVRAIDVDTKQIQNIEKLPAQISMKITVKEKEYDIQLNFENFPHYVNELVGSNIDFNLALHNPLMHFCNPSVIGWLKKLAETQFAVEKVRHMCLRRARRAMHQLDDVDNPSSKQTKPKPSEITDGIYRLLFASLMTNGNNASCNSFFTDDLSLLNLLAHHIDQCGSDDELESTVHWIYNTIQVGTWKEYYLLRKSSIANLIEKTSAKIQKRSSVALKNNPTNIPIAERLKLHADINKLFIELLLDHPGLVSVWK